MAHFFLLTSTAETSCQANYVISQPPFCVTTALTSITLHSTRRSGGLGYAP